MTLPDNFSSWEHLQSVLMRAHNPIVREEFRDVGDDSWEPDISTPRSSLRVACTLRDDDSATMTLIRLHLFYFTLRKAQDLQTPVYGIPVPSYQEARQFRPQIQLYFQEDLNDLELGYAPVTGEVSFRLMNETEETITEAELRSMATRIRNLFAAGNGFVWRKGKVQVTYTDRRRGYALRVLCRNKTDGKRLIEQVLDIQSHTPDWANMNVSENEEPVEAFPTVPPRETILGRSRRLPRKRPIADVRFQYAVAHIHGISNPIVLVDRSYTFRNAMESVRAV